MPSQVLDTVCRFVSNEIEPRAAEIDASNAYPWDLHEQAAELGLFGIALPEAYGGLGLDLRTRLEIIELVARCSGSFAIILSTCRTPFTRSSNAAAKDLKQEILPRVASGEWCPAFAMSEPSAGSDAAAMKAEARRTQEGYILNGTKTWCTHGGMADVLVVFAKTDPTKGSAGISAFLVRKDDPGFTVVRDEDLFSMRGSPQSTLEFSDCFVPEDRRLGAEGEGFRTAMKALDEARTQREREGPGSRSPPRSQSPRTMQGIARHSALRSSITKAFSFSLRISQRSMRLRGRSGCTPSPNWNSVHREGLRRWPPWPSSRAPKSG